MFRTGKLTSLLKLSSDWSPAHCQTGMIKMHAERSSHSLSSEPYICDSMFSGRCGDEDGASGDITASCSRSGGVSIWTWRKKVSSVSQLGHQTLWWVYLFGTTHLMSSISPEWQCFLFQRSRLVSCWSHSVRSWSWSSWSCRKSPTPWPLTFAWSTCPAGCTSPSSPHKPDWYWRLCCWRLDTARSDVIHPPESCDQHQGHLTDQALT